MADAGFHSILRRRLKSKVALAAGVSFTFAVAGTGFAQQEPAEGPDAPAVEAPSAGNPTGPDASAQGGATSLVPKEAPAQVASPEAAEAEYEVLEAGPSAAPAQSSMVKVSGYVDVGAFRAQNRGVGFIIDTTNAFAAQHPEIAWVLLGDPLATTVNSRGEPADTTGSFAFTHDAIRSAGALTFLVNEVNLDFSATPSSRLFIFTSLDLMPRTGFRGSLGDLFEVDYAYLDYTPFDTFDLTLSVGKFDSAFGREYRLQESPDRPGITPSLLFRYVGGHPIGVKARTRVFDKRLVLNVALSNGSSFIESMQQGEEVDRNDSKTVSGRLSYELPLPFGGRFDVGVSGETGAQSRQTEADIGHWQWGADGLLELGSVELRGEFVRGIAEGGGIDLADRLDYRAWHVEGFWRATSWLGLVARYEQRHAVNLKVPEFVYLIDIARITGGVRLQVHPDVAVKLEYLHNQELTPLPSFDNDVLTSSLVARF